jgi:tetratricopeptide (TPR) repeat protein
LDFRRADELMTHSPGRADVNRRRANLMNGLAWIGYKLRQHDSAATFFERASRLEPDNPAYHISLGNINWLISGPSLPPARYRQLIEDALAEYEKAIALTDKASARAYLFRTAGQFHYLLSTMAGHVYREELEKAIAADDNAIALDTTVAEYFLRRGQIHRALAYDLRLQDWPAYDSQPRDWPASLKHFNDAISDLSSAIQIGRPDSSEVKEASTQLVKAYRQLGWGYHLNHQDAEAISVNLQALQVNPKNVTTPSDLAIAHFGVGVIRLYMNDSQQARLDYRDAVAFTCTLATSESNTANATAKDELADLKRDRPDLIAIADEMLALVNNPHCSR